MIATYTNTHEQNMYVPPLSRAKSNRWLSLVEASRTESNRRLIVAEANRWLSVVEANWWLRPYVCKA